MVKLDSEEETVICLGDNGYFVDVNLVGWVPFLANEVD
jgi:hypothetical protein